MGKAKKSRTKLHLPSAVRKKNEETRQKRHQDGHESVATSAISMSETRSIRSLGSRNMKSNVFSGVSIPKSVLQQKLPDFDTQSKITSKTFRGLNLTKKDKLKIRHEAFIEKIKRIQTEKKAAAAKRRRSKTPVVGDMSVLNDSLPTLEMLMKQMESKPAKLSAKVRSIPKEKCRMRRNLDDLKLFQQVLSHSSYQSDPGATIREHLSNKMKQEETNR